MNETANLGIQLLSAGQAQKHVSINESFLKIDSLFMLSVRSRSTVTPPSSPESGDRYAVPAGALGAWAGKATHVAIFADGGWDFVQPRRGWRAFAEDEDLDIVFTNGVWREQQSAISGVNVLQVSEFEQELRSGYAQSSVATIPAGALVFGVTARIKEAVEGVTAWSLGTTQDPKRYGAFLLTGVGEVVRGATGAPLAYSEATPLLITPENGQFLSGRIRFQIHYLLLGVPS